MDMTKQSHIPIGQLVIEKPNRTLFFEQRGFDYCCGGNLSIFAIAEAKHLDLQAILNALETFDRQYPESGSTEDGCSSMTISERIDHIFQTHHQYLYRQFPCIDQLLQQVVKVHSATHPELIKLNDIYTALRTELMTHLYKEENVLFPYGKALDSGGDLPKTPCGSIQNPIQVMHREHEGTGQALQQIRELTQGFSTPSDTCGSYQALMVALQEMEKDIHTHIHQEENILFPQILQKANLLTVCSETCG